MGAEISAARVPLLPGARALAAAGVTTGGAQRNRAFAEALVDIDAGVALEVEDLLHDPQTSGGLLLAVAPERASDLRDALTGRSVPAWEIGRLTSGPAGRIAVAHEDARRLARLPALGGRSARARPGARVHRRGGPPDGGGGRGGDRADGLRARGGRPPRRPDDRVEAPHAGGVGGGRPLLPPPSRARRARPRPRGHLLRPGGGVPPRSARRAVDARLDRRPEPPRPPLERRGARAPPRRLPRRPYERGLCPHRARRRIRRAGPRDLRAPRRRRVGAERGEAPDHGGAVRGARPGDRPRRGRRARRADGVPGADGRPRRGARPGAADDHGRRPDRGAHVRGGPPARQRGHRRGGSGPPAGVRLDQLGAQPAGRHVLRPRLALPRPVGGLQRAAAGFRAPDRRLRAVAERLSDVYMDWRAMRALSLEILARLDDCRPAGRRDGGSGRAARPLDAEDLVRRGADARVGPRDPGARRPGPARRDRHRAHLPRRATCVSPPGPPRSSGR